MKISDASRIRNGTVMIHTRKGIAIARGPVTDENVWVDVPEDPLCPDIPYNAHISQLEFMNNEG